MSVWEAPAKINLSLELGPRDDSGKHPLRSLVQCLDWFDLLTFEEDDEDRLVIDGADLPDDGENLVWKAIHELRQGRSPQLAIRLDKQLPVAAGLGGGSSDAAASLAAFADLTGADDQSVLRAAEAVGSDVSLFLQGGLQWMEGYGERLTREKRVIELAVAVAVADVELPTSVVYRTWDDLDGPKGEELEGRQLPPPLRELGPLRNDLTPAAYKLRPELRDFAAELSEAWGQPVLMSGSGPSFFGFFADYLEASDAAAAAPRGCRARQAANLRRRGVERID